MSPRTYGNAMMHRIQIPRLVMLMSILVSLLAPAALSDEEPTAKLTVKPLKEWKGTNSTTDKAKNAVAENEDEFKKLWVEIHGNQIPQPDLPEIDFANQEVIAVFMGMRSSGGYSIAIRKVEDNDKRIVHYSESAPDPDMLTTQALTSPYHMILLPKSDKEVEFMTIQSTDR